MLHDVADILTAIAAIVAAVMAFNASKKSDENGTKIQAVHVDLNSRLTQLITATGAAAHAEGLEAGRKETRP